MVLRSRWFFGAKDAPAPVPRYPRKITTWVWVGWYLCRYCVPPCSAHSVPPLSFSDKHKSVSYMCLWECKISYLIVDLAQDLRFAIKTVLLL